MTRKRRAASVLLFCATVLLPLLAVKLYAQEKDRAHQVGSKVKCMCGGCDQSAGQCFHEGGSFSGPCDQAKSELRDIQLQIDQGKPDDQILQVMVKQYGTGVYMEPPKHGFGLLAWLMPALYLAAGTAFVLFIIGRWRGRSSYAGGSSNQASAPPRASDEELQRARERAARETEE